MAEAITHFDCEPIVVIPSHETIANPDIAWHAIRGYDFAGLEAILRQGIMQAENYNENNNRGHVMEVALSGAPDFSFARGLPADSFAMYSLSDGLSLAVKNPYLRPNQSYGGFHDEMRTRVIIEPDKIIGVMLPDQSLGCSLTKISTSHEIRKPLQATRLIERTVTHIRDLGGELDNDTASVVRDCLSVSMGGQTLTREQSSQLEAMLMRSYAKTFDDKLGIKNPTVIDVLKAIFDRTGTRPRVITYTPEQKREIYSRNVDIISHNRASEIGRFGLRST